MLTSTLRHSITASGSYIPSCKGAEVVLCLKYPHKPHRPHLRLRFTNSGNPIHWFTSPLITGRYIYREVPACAGPVNMRSPQVLKVHRHSREHIRHAGPVPEWAITACSRCGKKS